MGVGELLDYANDNDIEVYIADLPETKACSVTVENRSAVGMDEELSTEEFFSALLHEICHCLSKTFYTSSATEGERVKLEGQADRKAIKLAFPKEEIKKAISQGCYEVWQLAEYFNCTYALIEKALIYYDMRG